MKYIKSLSLLSLLLLLFNCSKEENELVKEVKFSNFTIKAEPLANALRLDWEDVTVSSNQKIKFDVYVDGKKNIENIVESNCQITGLKTYRLS